MISQKTIDLIQNTADIVDVVSDYVSLQPAGKNFKGLCPFHSEKTPSFFVSKERNIFNCFGCGEKGGAVQFLQKYKNISFVEALEQLAQKYHIEMETDTKIKPSSNFERYYRINEQATKFYEINLTNLEKGKTALDYLIKRGLDIHTIQYFEMGYAPNEFDSLYLQLHLEFEPLDLLEIGLIKKSTDAGYYDLFRDRIIFPIRNELGKVVGFSGRIYQDLPLEAKYVNSPFTKIFTKGEFLYNLDRAIPFIKREKRVVLYEGFMDVIASVNAGIKESVCSMGTALTEMQAKLIKKYTDTVLLCYDGDSAGFEAMHKAIQVLEAQHLNVSLILLPEELDPDDYVKKYSKSDFSHYLSNNQIDVHEFNYQHLKKDLDFSKASNIEKLKLSMFEYLIKLDSGMVMEIYTKRLAEDIQVDFETIKSDLHHYQLTKIISQTLNNRKTKSTDVAIMEKNYQAELTLMNYYLKSQEFREIIDRELTSYFAKDPLIKEILINILELVETKKDGQMDRQLLKQFSAQKQKTVESRLLDKNYSYSLEDLTQLIMTVKCRDIELEIEELKKIAEEYKKTDQSKYLEIHSKIKTLKHKIDALRKDTLWKKTK